MTIERESGMACRAQGTVEQGEGIHAAARSIEPAAPGAAMGESREGIRVRWPERQRDAGRSIRRRKPANCVPLHVWSWVGGRLPELFVHFGPYRRQRCAPRSTRRKSGGGFASAAAANRGL